MKRGSRIILRMAPRERPKLAFLAKPTLRKSWAKVPDRTVGRVPKVTTRKR